MLAFSTCWNSSRHQSGSAMLQEIIDMGFRHVELGHGIKISLVPDILDFQEKGKIEVVSLHNFCPLPIEVMRDSPDCYEFSSHRTTDRDRAVRLTIQTIDYAARLNARKVVLHLGSIASMHFSTHKLIEMVKAGNYLTKEYARLKLDLVKEREAKSAAYLARVEECIKPIIDYAGERGIRLGIECRNRYEEIPSEREIPSLLERLGKTCGYWHDFGHQQIKANLGLSDHAEWLKKIGMQTIGCHLHDTVWPDKDHRPPFAGEIDYKKLLSFLPKDCLFVLEMSPRNSREDILSAVDRWKTLFNA